MTTDRQACPWSGWKGCVIRISGGTRRLAVVDCLGEGQGRAERRVREAPLLRPLPRLRELGPPEPGGRAVAARGSRSTGPRDRPRGRGGALRPGGARPSGRCRPGATTRRTGSGARSAGMPTSRSAAIATACPRSWPGSLVTVRLSLEGQLSVYDGEQLVAQHVLQPADRGWVTVPGHHAGPLGPAPSTSSAGPWRCTRRRAHGTDAASSSG